MRFDVGAIGKLERTPTGGVRVPARVTRSGVFPYRRADGSTVLEYRPEAEVFAGPSLASLADCAVTVAHPASGSVTPETFKRDSVGYVRDPGTRDAQFVATQLVVQDADAIARIDAGDLIELSCGYGCLLEMTPGVTPGGERYDAIQRDVVYNHVALLPRGGGRAGRDVALRLDGAAVALPDSEPEQRNDSMKTEKIDGVDYTIGSPEWTQANAQRLARLDADLAASCAKCDELTKQLDAVKAELAGKQAALDAQTAALACATDETKLDAHLDARAQLLARARSVLGTSTKLDGKTADTIRREVLTKLDGAACVEGKDESFVTAFFTGRMAAVASSAVASARVDSGASAPVVDLSRYRVRPGDR